MVFLLFFGLLRSLYIILGKSISKWQGDILDIMHGDIQESPRQFRAYPIIREIDRIARSELEQKGVWPRHLG